MLCVTIFLCHLAAFKASICYIENVFNIRIIIIIITYYNIVGIPIGKRRGRYLLDDSPAPPPRYSGHSVPHGV